MSVIRRISFLVRAHKKGPDNIVSSSIKRNKYQLPCLFNISRFSFRLIYINNRNIKILTGLVLHDLSFLSLELRMFVHSFIHSSYRLKYKKKQTKNYNSTYARSQYYFRCFNKYFHLFPRTLCTVHDILEMV